MRHTAALGLHMPRTPGTRREVTGNTIRGRYHDARRVLDQLATVGVNFEDVTDQLEREGLAKFEKSWNQLSHTIAAELHRNHPARQS